MSMHKIELTDLERKGLELHRLPIGTPSQSSDCFRNGIKWALENTRTQSQWISVDDVEPKYGVLYWHTHIKSDGSFTEVRVGSYSKPFKKMDTGNFTHYMECVRPLPPLKEQG